MTDTAVPLNSGAKAAAISNMTVRLLNQYTGRGPTRARTFFNDDMVTVVLQDTLTRGETTLVAHDHDQMVLATRKTFQDTMAAALTAGVEEIVGREVVAFLSANHIEPDYAVETFILGPAAEARNGARPMRAA